MNSCEEIPEDSVWSCMFSTHAAAGGAVAPSGAFSASDFRIYKDDGTGEKTTTNGITVSSEYDSVVGLHFIKVDTSVDTGDSGFWAAGSRYFVVLKPDETIDSKNEIAVVGCFKIKPTGGALDLLSSISSRIPSALGANGNIKADVMDYGGSAGAFADGRPETNTARWKGSAPADLTTGGYVQADTAKIGGSTIQQAGGYVRARGTDDLALASEATADAAKTAAESARDDLANGTDGLGAIMSAITNLTGNMTASAIAPKSMERPDTGSKTYRMHLMLYDLDGNMEAPDSAPTIVAENDQGSDRSANLGAVSLVSTGHYRVDYTVASDHAIEALTFIWSVVEGGKTRKISVATYVAETTAELFTAADRAKLDTLHDTRITAQRATNLDELGAANIPADIDTLKTRIPGTVQPQTGDSYARLGSPAGASFGDDIAAMKAVADAIKLKTDNLPVSPANQTDLLLIKAVTTKLDTALELDGAVYRFTTNALEQAPTGGGGGGGGSSDENAVAIPSSYTAGTVGGLRFGLLSLLIGKRTVTAGGSLGYQMKIYKWNDNTTVWKTFDMNHPTSPSTVVEV